MITFCDHVYHNALLFSFSLRSCLFNTDYKLILFSPVTTVLAIYKFRDQVSLFDVYLRIVAGSQIVFLF